MVRILHILDHSIPLQSGYTFRTRNILLHQRRFGWETVHVTSMKHRGALLAEELVENLKFYRTLHQGSSCAHVPALGQWQVVRTLAQKLKEVVEKERPDILHAHSPALNGIAALAVGRKFGLPVLYECRAFWEDAAVDHGTASEFGLRYRLSRALESWVFRNAAAVTTICEGLKDEITGRGIPDAKVTVIPNGVDTEDFQSNRPVDPVLADRLNLGGKVVLGFIGSFYAYEGLVLLIEAMPRIMASNPHVRLLLVGGGPQETLLRQRIASLGIEQVVIMTGRIPHEEVRNYYNLVDILVYPRLPMRLTDLVTPLKPLEAMAQGKLVVASDVGGHRELIQPNRTGLLFRAGDAESLAATVIHCLAHRDQWPLLQAAGRQFVETERNWHSSVERYRPVYRGLVR